MKEELEILFKEYDTLRNESLDAIKNRSQILSFGLTAIGLLLATLYRGQAVAINDVIIFLNILIPIISSCVLLIWLGEVERMMRAGFHIVKLEQRINNLSTDAYLSWESDLRNKDKQMIIIYGAIIALFLVVFGIGSLFLSRVIINENNFEPSRAYTSTFIFSSLVILVTIIITALSCYRFMTKYSRTKGI